jgi:hypothetical protein
VVAVESMVEGHHGTVSIVEKGEPATKVELKVLVDGGGKNPTWVFSNPHCG